MILPYRGVWPKIHETAFIASSVDIIGDVEVGAHSNVWFQCVIRGDVHRIRIGSKTNIQDQSVLHVTRGQSSLTVGDEVTVGHRVTLHGCKIGNRVLVGMGSVILDDAEIGDECLIGAGSLVTSRTKIPPRSLVLGAPAKVVRTLTQKELDFLPKSAAHYVDLGVEYRSFVTGPVRLGQSQIDLEFFPEDFRESGRSSTRRGLTGSSEDLEGHDEIDVLDGRARRSDESDDESEGDDL